MADRRTPRAWSATDHAIILAHAADRRSLAEAARALGPDVTRNMVIRRAIKLGARFDAPPVIGGGCTSEQARAGWATRRGAGA